MEALLSLFASVGTLPPMVLLITLCLFLDIRWENGRLAVRFTISLPWRRTRGGEDQ